MKRTRVLWPLNPRSAAALLLLLVAGRSETAAHGGALPLADWGGFSSPTARCQRIIGRTAARCTLRASSARRACLDRTIAGQICDEAATNALILSARRQALDEVDLYCSDNQAQTLGYLGLFELQGDIIRFCREWEDLVTATVYEPVLPADEPLDPESVECVAGVSAGVDKLAELVFRTWRGCLNRIATRPFELAEKQDLIADADDRLTALQSRAASAFSDACGEERFETIYDSTAATFASYIRGRAGCYAPAFYVQDGTPCPPSVCGNGIVEPGEGCDDGDLDDGDGCNSGCIVE
jgi:cysteine-rich repeat protein